MRRPSAFLGTCELSPYLHVESVNIHQSVQQDQHYNEKFFNSNYGHTNSVLPKFYDVVWFTVHPFLENLFSVWCIQTAILPWASALAFAFTVVQVVVTNQISQSVTQVILVISTLANSSKFKFLCAVFEISWNTNIAFLSHTFYFNIIFTILVP